MEHSTIARVIEFIVATLEAIHDSGKPTYQIVLIKVFIYKEMAMVPDTHRGLVVFFALRCCQRERTRDSSYKCV